jgi:hypothetical protein
VATAGITGATADMTSIITGVITDTPDTIIAENALAEK